MKKIIFFTSNRSEWGLLELLFNELNKFRIEYVKYDFWLNVIITGSHLSPLYNTFKEINSINKEFIECSLSSDTNIGTCKSMGLLMLSLTESFNRNKPNLVVILGDRYESMICALVCHTMNIKVLHLHAGEKSGNIDDAFRDCISRFSFAYCTATEKSTLNLLNFGYENVYYTGALGCCNLPKKNNKNSNKILVMYHPVTSGEKEDFDELINVLYKFKKDYYIYFIMANNDYGGQDINKKIKGFSICRSDQIKSFNHLQRNDFLKLLSESLCIMGNSSAGIIEAPMIGIPTINIGSRQKNRERASSIIDVECNSEKILNVLNKLEENNFEPDLSYIPYSKQNAVENIIDVIVNKIGDTI